MVDRVQRSSSRIGGDGTLTSIWTTAIISPHQSVGKLGDVFGFFAGHGDLVGRDIPNFNIAPVLFVWRIILMRFFLCVVSIFDGNSLMRLPIGSCGFFR